MKAITTIFVPDEGDVPCVVADITPLGFPLVDEDGDIYVAIGIVRYPHSKTSADGVLCYINKHGAALPMSIVQCGLVGR